ncbi:S41 family peptidase [Pontibacter sp. H259]|uniref:S41 family peptidase n=1 Tax=Pontibacter sp. H259 TaxID=3133421 RepID=UPI0030BF0437
MKLFKICFVFVFILLAGQSAQSSTNPEQVNKKATDRIAAFTKVWGLLKYYHPQVAAGSINWDSVFVAYVPKVTAAKNQKQFYRLMDELYTSVPAAKLAPKYNLPKADTITSVFTTSEIGNYTISANLKKQLEALYERHLPAESKYITNKYKEYTLDYVLFLEEPMADVAYPNQETRLLALARYWNTINFFYPHKQTIGKNWDTLLETYIPVFSEVKDETAYHLAIQKLNRELVDSHAFLRSPVLDGMWGPKPPFYLSYVEDKFVVTKLVSDSLATAQGIKLGDVVVSINGKPVKERVDYLLPLLRCSNQATTYRDIADYLLHVDNTNKVTIELQRGPERITKSIDRYPYQQLMKLQDKPKQELWREVAESIIWVDFGAIKDTTKLPALFAELKNAKTVIWDLRKYPNYDVYLQAIPALFQQQLPVSMSANAMVNYPGFFTESTAAFERPEKTELTPYFGNMIVLVNEYTQSMGESCALNLAQRPNTIVMGSQTAGTTGNVTWLPLPGGARIAFTGVGERGAKGTFEQRKGVRIEKQVKQTIASIKSGKDALLEAAILEAQKQSIGLKE